MSGWPIDRPKASTHIIWVTHSYSRNKQIAYCKFGKRHCNRQLVRGDGGCATERERRDNSDTASEEIMLDLAWEKGSYGIPPLYRCARECWSGFVSFWAYYTPPTFTEPHVLPFSWYCRPNDWFCVEFDKICPIFQMPALTDLGRLGCIGSVNRLFWKNR